MSARRLLLALAFLAADRRRRPSVPRGRGQRAHRPDAHRGARVRRGAQRARRRRRGRSGDRARAGAAGHLPARLRRGGGDPRPARGASRPGRRPARRHRARVPAGDGGPRGGPRRGARHRGALARRARPGARAAAPRHRGRGARGPHRRAGHRLASPHAHRRRARPALALGHDGAAVRERADHRDGGGGEVGEGDPAQPTRQSARVPLAGHAGPRAHPPRGDARDARPRAALAPGGRREARRGPLARAWAVRRPAVARCGGDARARAGRLVLARQARSEHRDAAERGRGDDRVRGSDELRALLRRLGGRRCAAQAPSSAEGGGGARRRACRPSAARISRHGTRAGGRTLPRCREPRFPRSTGSGLRESRPPSSGISAIDRASRSCSSRAVMPRRR